MKLRQNSGAIFFLCFFSASEKAVVPENVYKCAVVQCLEIDGNKTKSA